MDGSLVSVILQSLYAHLDKHERLIDVARAMASDIERFRAEEER